MFAFIIALIVVVLVVILLSRSLAKPIESMANIAQQIEQGNLQARFHPSNVAEFSYLARIFNQMTASLYSYHEQLEDKVRERTDELSLANSELSASMNALKQAQTKLIESKKMASLGGLVAGIAHEVNTPIGAGLSAATHLQEFFSATNSQYKSDTLTESNFEKLLVTAEDSLVIIVRNLQRSSELIQSFKRVAVDQTNDHIEEFELCSYLKQVIASLAPNFKHLKLDIEVECDQAIVITQSPGVFAQITTNLITNAIIHGFGERPAGKIRIKINQDEASIDLQFSDNGKGIDDDTLGKIFDPFFTTNRKAGGSGLGLHILYNLVSQSLNGEITVKSEIDKGTQFFITFPRNSSSVSD